MWLSCDLGIWPLASIGRDLCDLLAEPQLPFSTATPPPPPLCDWFYHDYSPLLLLLFSTSTTITATTPRSVVVCSYRSQRPFAAPHFPRTTTTTRKNHTPILHFLAVNHISTAGSSTFFPSLFSSSVVISQPIICILHTAARYDSMGLRLSGTASTLVLLPERSISKSGFAFHSSFLPSPHYSSLRPPPRPFHPPSTIHHHLPISHRPPAHTFTTS